MVSFWPWRGDDTSPASFEKTLSTLSGRIAKATTKLESRRQRARRVKALWTLYSSFAYLLYVMIVALVVGWKNWGTTEYTGIAAAPVVIYVVRLAVTVYYDYRVSSLESNVEDLQKQRDTAITKLKAATKYDSTQQLLEKYGGASPKPKPRATENRKQNSGQKHQAQTQERTSFAPPPTANIPGRNAHSPLPITPLRESPQVQFGRPPPGYPVHGSPQWQQAESPQEPPSADFAPNAFPPSSQHYAAQVSEGPKWYDRFMDVLLGEDEAHPKNRIVLICENCRLVNGQAPPGVRSLEDVGKWRCAQCGTMNGEESEAKQLMKAIKEKERTEIAGEHTALPPAAYAEDDVPDEEEVALVEGPESDVTQYSEEEDEEGEGKGEGGKDAAPPVVAKKEEDEEEHEQPAPSRRSGRSKGKSSKAKA